VLAAIKYDGMAFSNTSDELRNNPELVMIAV
jgi:hypothetical protein